MGRELTYEEIAELIVNRLTAEGVLAPERRRVPWPAFLRLSSLVHDQFEVPGTTLTPMMRRLLFAVGHAARASTVVGAGTYVGYAFAWLLRDRRDPEAGPFCDRGIAVDISSAATALAARNLAWLAHGKRVRAVRGDAVEVLSGAPGPIDLLFIDLDDPARGKADYAEVLRVARGSLVSGAVVLAHDPCVPRFEDDFRRYDAMIAALGLDGPWVLPVDACGISIARVPP